MENKWQAIAPDKSNIPHKVLLCSYHQGGDNWTTDAVWWKEDTKQWVYSSRGNTLQFSNLPYTHFKILNDNPDIEQKEKNLYILYDKYLRIPVKDYKSSGYYEFKKYNFLSVKYIPFSASRFKTHYKYNMSFRAWLLDYKN